MGLVLGLAACRGAGPYGYAPNYVPTSDEQGATKDAREYDPVMYQREPEVWRKSSTMLFGVVTGRAPGPGEGAGTQTPGEYGLVASRHEREGGVFPVNYRTGEMSICYVFDEKVVCTPQTNPNAPAASAPQASSTPTVRSGTGSSPQRP